MQSKDGVLFDIFCIGQSLFTSYYPRGRDESLQTSQNFPVFAPVAVASESGGKGQAGVGPSG
jgi:hypothetical protein